MLRLSDEELFFRGSLPQQQGQSRDGGEPRDTEADESQERVEEGARQPPPMLRRLANH